VHEPWLVLFGGDHTSNDIEIVWTAAGIEWLRNSALGSRILSQTGGSEQGHPVSTAQLLSIADMQLKMTPFDSVIEELMHRGFVIQAENTNSESNGFNDDRLSLLKAPNANSP